MRKEEPVKLGFKGLYTRLSGHKRYLTSNYDRNFQKESLDSNLGGSKSMPFAAHALGALLADVARTLQIAVNNISNWIDHSTQARR